MRKRLLADFAGAKILIKFNPERMKNVKFLNE